MGGIIILGSGGGADDTFEPCTEGVDFELSALVEPKRCFVPDNDNVCTDLSAAQIGTLRDFADWKTTFPCHRPEPGRSLWAVIKAGQEWPVAGIKMKGAGGIRTAGGHKLECYSPKPAALYTQLTEFHLSNSCY